MIKNIEAYFKITYGLYILSSRDGEKLNGHISNAIFQVTADPPRFAIATNKDNLTTEYIQKSKAFAVSILQQNVDLNFMGPWGFKSGREINKFENVNYKTGITGVPIVLDKAIAWFEYELIEAIDVGTHMMFIGKVVDGDLIDPNGTPLTYDYYRKVIKGVSPKNAPTYLEKVDKDGELEEKEAGAQKYQCIVCGLIYDPEEGDPDSGIDPGTAFEDIPDDWQCPVCGVTKSDFRPI